MNMVKENSAASGSGVMDWIKGRLLGRSHQLSRPSRELKKRYKVQGLIERGGYGDVWLCVARGDKREDIRTQDMGTKGIRTKDIRTKDLGTGTGGRSSEQPSSLVACKVIEKDRLERPSQKQNVQREVEVMRRLTDAMNHHRHGETAQEIVRSTHSRDDFVVELKEVVESNSKVEIVMEYCNRGDLHDLISHKGPLSESVAKVLFTQVVLGLDFCLAQGVVHRDIKAENVLLTSADGQQDLQAKLCDFGLAAVMDGDGMVAGSTGSMYWTAPEVVEGGKFGPAADVWSLGLLLYSMLTGNLPKNPQLGRKGHSIWQRYYQGPLYLEGVRKWEDIPALAQDLLKKMLRFRPKERIEVEQILAHPWVAGCCGSLLGPAMSEDGASSAMFSRTSSVQSLLTLAASSTTEGDKAMMCGAGGDTRWSHAYSSPQGMDLLRLRQLSLSQGQSEEQSDGSWHGPGLLATRSKQHVLK